MNNNNVVKVLDKGFVRLVDHMGSDLSIVRNARVSYDAAWRTGEDSGSDHRLINYLYSNGHNTPFESCTITFEVKAPIFVFRQWHRHRTQSYNELSARYKPLPDEWYVPEPELIGTQSTDNKQMRDVSEHDDLSHAIYIAKAIQSANQVSYNAYQNLLKTGCPREIARSVLPMGMYSHMFTTMNLHNLFKFLSERLHEHAQYEIKVYAQTMLDIIEPLYPVATECFVKGLLKNG